MPTLLLAAPVAALLAWLALRSRRPKGARGAPEGPDGAFAPGSTGRLTADVGEEEEPFKRRLLPEATGGELGQYGPLTQEQAPSGVHGGELPPGPTQTYTAYGTAAARALFAGPTSPVYTGQPSPLAGPTSPVYIPGQPAPTFYGGGAVIQPGAVVAE